MAYIGVLPVVGEFRKLDDISGQFNNSNAVFNLTVAGSAVLAGSAQNLIISVDGIIQEPQASFTVGGTTLTFTEAPNTASTFFGILLGSVAQVGTVSDGAITTEKIANGAITAAKLAANAITTEKIADGSITSAKLAANAIISVANGGTGNTTATFASLTSNVYGILPAGNGGTGFNGSSASNGQLPIGNGSGFTANTITGTTNRITVSNGVGAITLTTPQDLHTTATIQFAALGVGTNTFGSTGDIRATNNITAFFSSDNRYKENVRDIDNALDKVNHIGGKYFDWTDTYISAQGGADGYFMIKSDFGVIAQDVQKVFPVAVRERPDGSLAVDYEKLVSLAFAAIKELKSKVEKLES